SRYDRLSTVALLDGWHAAEGTGWRWTSQTFAAQMRWLGSSFPTAVTLNLFLPESLIEFAKRNDRSVTLSAEVNGRPLEPEMYQRSGNQAYFRALPELAGRTTELLFRFSLSCALPPDDDDQRERGVIVTSLSVD